MMIRKSTCACVRAYVLAMFTVLVGERDFLMRAVFKVSLFFLVVCLPVDHVPPARPEIYVLRT